MSDSIIKVFFGMTLNIKLYHWTTKSYSRHKASDQLASDILPLIDQFIEMYAGRYKRPEGKLMNIAVKKMSDKEIVSLIGTYISFLQKDLPKQLKATDTDLLTVRDSMLSSLNQALYLFTLS